MADNHAFDETLYRVHEGNGDEFFEIGPDGDRVEIRLRSSDGKEVLERMTCNPDTAKLIAKRLIHCADDLKENPVHPTEGL